MGKNTLGGQSPGGGGILLSASWMHACVCVHVCAVPFSIPYEIWQFRFRYGNSSTVCLLFLCVCGALLDSRVFQSILKHGNVSLWHSLSGFFVLVNFKQPSDRKTLESFSPCLTRIFMLVVLPLFVCLLEQYPKNCTPPPVLEGK